MKALKFYPVYDNHAYTVSKLKNSYVISFVTYKMVNGVRELTLIKHSTSKEILLAFSNPFTADYILRTLILPVYKDPYVICALQTQSSVVK